MRIQCIVLEDHRDIAVLRGNIIDQFPVNVEFAAGNFFETCHHTQGRRLSASGRSDQHDKLLIIDMEVKVMHCRNLVVVHLLHVFD